MEPVDNDGFFDELSNMKGNKSKLNDGLEEHVLEQQITRLLNKVNAVTCPYRHGQKVTDRALTELSNRQIDVEKALRDMGL